MHSIQQTFAPAYLCFLSKSSICCCSNFCTFTVSSSHRQDFTSLRPISLGTDNQHRQRTRSTLLTAFPGSGGGSGGGSVARTSSSFSTASPGSGGGSGGGSVARTSSSLSTASPGSGGGSGGGSVARYLCISGVNNWFIDMY